MIYGQRPRISKYPGIRKCPVLPNTLYFPLCSNRPAQKYLCISSISLIYKYKRPSIYTQLKQKNTPALLVHNPAQTQKHAKKSINSYL